MWRIHKTRIDSRTECWRIQTDAGAAVSFEEAFRLWKGGQDFGRFWQLSLADAPFDAYCWECPPVTAACSRRPFECVLVSSPLLDRAAADPAPFAKYFHAGCDAVTFESLGRDALLVAPCPDGRGGDSAHLARFVATASEAQGSALWQRVGEALEKRVGDRPVWLSTSGHGISWLHVRLDTRPKYYCHLPYKSARFSASGTGE